MEKERFWFGTALIALPLIFLFVPLLMPEPVIKDIQTAPFEGRVSVNGRPLTHGFIVFYPEDETSDPASSYIDATGHFQIGPRWLRNRASATNYRICVVPSRSEQFHDLMTPEEAARDYRSHGLGTIPAVEIEQLSKPQTTKLKVQLDDQTTEVDVDL